MSVLLLLPIASASATEAAAGSESAGASVNLLDLPLFDSLKQEWSNTVQDCLLHSLAQLNW